MILGKPIHLSTNLRYRWTNIKKYVCKINTPHHRCGQKMATLEFRITCFKGQLISKCPYEKSVSSKIPTKIFLHFCPEIFCSFLGASWKLFELPWGLSNTLDLFAPDSFKIMLSKGGSLWKL